MQIVLKQSEIEAGLRAYIASQGINLSGRTVGITFTAGRKESGISAELEINDIEGYPVGSGPLPRSMIAVVKDYTDVVDTPTNAVVVPPDVEPMEEPVVTPKSGVSLFS